MKKVFSILLVFILVLGFSGCGKSSKSGKVKVYMFEAGGCPYCEAQMDYLKSLDGYDKTFEVVVKELYVDHVEWKQGKDYELGVKVANAFYDAGFEQASYQGTPFVVISDIYAAASYNANLEGTIKETIDEGDNDIVGCFEKGDKCDIRENLSETDKKINNIEKSNLIHFVIIYVLIGAVVVYLICTRNQKNVPSKVSIKKEVEKIEEKENKPAKKTTKKKK